VSAEDTILYEEPQRIDIDESAPRQLSGSNSLFYNCTDKFKAYGELSEAEREDDELTQDMITNDNQAMRAA